MRQDILDGIITCLLILGHLLHFLDAHIDVVDYHHGRLPLYVCLHLAVNQG